MIRLQGVVSMQREKGKDGEGERRLHAGGGYHRMQARMAISGFNLRPVVINYTQ